MVTAANASADMWWAAAYLAVALVMVLVKTEAAEVRVQARTLGTLDTADPTPAPAPDDPVATRPRVSVSRAGVALPLVLVICGCATGLTLLGPLPGATDRFDPRASRSEEPDVRTTLSPLVALKRQLTSSPAVPMFTISAAAGSVLPQRVRTAYLSDFDGVIWRDSDDFVRPPATISTGLPTTGRSAVTVRMAIAELPGPYLPVVGDPLSVTGDGLARGQARGNLVSTGGSPTGRAYAVTALVPLDSTDVRLKTATTGGPEWRPGDVELPPGLPDGVRAVALTATAGASSPYEKALALQGYLRQVAGYSLKAPPGESYAAVSLLLGKQTPYTAAFAELRASAYAILARAIGLPARVAIGYRLPASTSGSSVTVTTAEAHAWPEVLFDPYGWVAFEPTDATSPDQERPPDTPAGPGESVPETGTGGDQVATVDPNLTDAGPGAIKQAVVILLLLVALALIAAAAVVVMKRVRRHRRRTATGSARMIAGAWAESLDRLTENGIRPSASSTPQEVADRLAVLAGSKVAQPVDRLAPLMAAAVFAPEPPDIGDATSAWRYEAELASSLAMRRPWVLRFGRHVDPRPLAPSRKRLGGPARRSGVPESSDGEREPDDEAGVASSPAEAVDRDRGGPRCGGGYSVLVARHAGVSPGRPQRVRRAGVARFLVGRPARPDRRIHS